MITDKQLEHSSDDIVEALRAVANSITPSGVMGGHDAEGGYVASLTEAVMGMTKSIGGVADALNRIAQAMEDRNEAP